MKLISAEDRRVLENKYHLVDQPFNAYDRFSYHGYDYDPSTGYDDAEMDAGLAALAPTLTQLSHPEQKARLVAFVMEHTRIDVNPHDYFVGFYTMNRPVRKYTSEKWQKELLAAGKGVGAGGKYTCEEWQKELSDTNCAQALAVLDETTQSGMQYGWLDYEHTVPDWDCLMELGFPGILRRARENYAALVAAGTVTEKQTAFFRGIETEYEAILALLRRLLAYAEAQTHEKAPIVAESLRHLLAGAPQTSLDAMELIYIYFMISEHMDQYQVRSLGLGLDHTLYPFYKRDLASGTITEDDFTLYLSYFFMQWSAIGNYWGQPLYLAGTHPDGTTKVNEVSYLILRVYRALGIYNPKIQIKTSLRTPKAFVMEALDMIRSGSSSIVFNNEDHIVRTLMARGDTFEEAHDGFISGCYEYNRRKGSLDISATYPNAVKPVLLAMENGFDRTIGRQIGPETGDAASFVTFGDFYHAYLTQLKYQFVRILDALKTIERYSGQVNPSTLYSATVPKLSETMTEALEGGVDNDCTLVLGGLGSAADCLMAVRELVYEKKLVTLPELTEILKKNWVGYEPLRQVALRSKHKYGNGDAMTDSYVDAILTYIRANICGGRTTAYGGHVLIDGHSARAYIILGERTPATPDGRRDGEEISKNISPAQGMDRNGITALIRSATSVDCANYTRGGCLDAMLHPSAVQGQEGLDAFYAVLMTFLRGGGPGIHFNIFDPEQLKEAQKNPEKYPGLQIRVCGWNILWNDMPKIEQDEYIKRAENIL